MLGSGVAKLASAALWAAKASTPQGVARSGASRLTPALGVSLASACGAPILAESGATRLCFPPSCRVGAWASAGPWRALPLVRRSRASSVSALGRAAGHGCERKEEEEEEGAVATALKGSEGVGW